MLTVHVTGAGARGVHDELQRLSAGRGVAVDEPAHAAISVAVLGLGLTGPREPEADAVLVDVGDPARLHQQVVRLWERRLGPWLSALDAGRVGSAPAAYDHIGSTAVPGLVAKPFVDLQVCLPAAAGRTHPGCTATSPSVVRTCPARCGSSACSSAPTPPGR